MSCGVCAGIDPNLTNVANGRNLGVSEASVRRHKAHMVPETDSFFTEVPVDLITSRGSTRRLIDGSYEKVTWKPNSKAILDSLSYDDLERAIVGFNPEPRQRTHFGAPAAVLNASDLQVGKANQRGGGTPEMSMRVMQSFADFAEYLKVNRPREAMLADGGDIIENIFNTPAQAVTNDLDVPAQIRTARRLMIEGIKMLAPLVEEFTYLAVPSNHGAFRTGYKAAGGTTDADFGLDISYQLEDVCRESAALQHVKFVRPEPLEETAIVSLSGTKIAYHHGYQSGGLFRHGEWWARQDHGRRPGWDADVLVTAHYHTDAHYRSGDGRLVVCCASSDTGSDWFTNRTGESALPGMSAFDVRDGKLSNLRLV